MSRQDVQRMMMQNVGLAGHIVAFGAIWRAIADHGGYANVSYDTLSVNFAPDCSLLRLTSINHRSATKDFGNQ